MNDLDRTLFLLLNAPSDEWGFLAYAAFVWAKFVIFLIPLHLALLWIAGDRSVRRQSLILLTALLVAIGISYGLGVAFPTDRPFITPLGHALMSHRASPSFPSNHGLIFFTYAATMGMLRHWRYAFAIGAGGLVVAWSRIYLGVHFPLDMVGAALVAVLAALIAMRLDRRFGREATDRAEDLYEALALRPLKKMMARLR